MSLSDRILSVLYALDSQNDYQVVVEHGQVSITPLPAGYTLQQVLDIANGVSPPPTGYVWSGDELIKQSAYDEQKFQENTKNFDQEAYFLLKIFDGCIESFVHLRWAFHELHNFEDDVDAKWPLHEEIAAAKSKTLYEVHLFLEAAFEKFFTALSSFVDLWRNGKRGNELVNGVDHTPPAWPTVQAGEDIAYYRARYLELVDRRTDEVWAQKFTGSLFGLTFYLEAEKDAQEFISKGYPANDVPKLVSAYAAITGLSNNAAADDLVLQAQQLRTLAATIEPQRRQVRDQINAATTKGAMSSAYRQYLAFLRGL